MKNISVLESAFGLIARIRKSARPKRIGLLAATVPTAAVAHEEGKFNSFAAVLGNDGAIKAYRAGTLPFPDIGRQAAGDSVISKTANPFRT